MANVSESILGFLPPHIFCKGPIGILSKSSTLAYDIISTLSAHNLGQSFFACLGGSMLSPTGFTDLLPDLESHPQTKIILLITQIGSSDEEKCLNFIKSMSKPILAYIVGKSAPVQKTMGHSSAIINTQRETYQYKYKLLTEAGVKITSHPLAIPDLIKSIL